MRRHAKALSAGSTLGIGSSRARTGRALACLLGLLAFAGISAPAAGAAAPQVTELFPLTVTQNTASLRAQINPGGKSTTYHFEYGTGNSFDKRIPTDHELFVGSGTEPVTVSATLNGLSEETAYRYRVVAVNADGTTSVPARELSTLNDEGLAWGRRYELVSPADKGPHAQAGQPVVFGADLQYQASLDGTSIAYPLSYGLPDGTAGGEVLYRSDLTPSSWLSSQLAPSMVGTSPPTQKGTGNTYIKPGHWLSSDLECGFVVSSLNLTGEAVAQPIIDAGSYNLYRHNPDGSYDLVSNLTPTNLADGDELLSDTYLNPVASEDCDRVIFETELRYPGIPLTEGAQLGFRLYEWRADMLRNPAGLPGSTGLEFPVRARPGASDINALSSWNALSEDGSRFYFTSTAGGTSSALGRLAVFLRDDTEPTKDITASQTATANNGNSRYQMATPDGSEVFFLARYGLAGNATSTGATTCTLTEGEGLGVGCDLYRYSADTGTLVDVSASSNPADTAGASVAGVLDASEDGSRVYFAAKGQLIAGQGQTYLQNTTDPTRGYNIYLWDEGAPLAYVATVRQVDVTGGSNGGVLVSSPNVAASWASRTTPDGDYLVFQSTASITGPEGVLQAYRYSADSGQVECISCRRDGQLVLGAGGEPPLMRVSDETNEYSHPMPGFSEDGQSVFFRSRDALATNAIDAASGTRNLYEWRDGQVTLLVGEIASMPSPFSPVQFRGASVDGSVVFFRSRSPLVPWDTDGHNDIYAARIGGGFPAPPEPPAQCDPLSEACAGAAGSAATAGDPASSRLKGQGNAQPPAPACKASQVRRGERCVSKRAIAKKACAELKGKAKQRCIRNHVQRLHRAINTDRRAGK